ncbi:hypothetical protein B9Z55_013212 [Caenorhabditis nigoni]|uniref:Tc1-like transposase DDE domain-containing protein n=1 Tax=Caenorhabditis nigoni TaxID=1611254 RepID=A0A2G5U160_9PELO|nr:hypothetical protein B9Z55_013212 [Caenorhabditis nigoni]
MTKKVYIDGIFKKHLFLWTKCHFGRDHLIHHHEAAPVYTAKRAQQWLEEHLPGGTNYRPTRRIRPRLTIPSGVMQKKICSRSHSSFQALEEILPNKRDKVLTVPPSTPTKYVFRP